MKKYIILILVVSTIISCNSGNDEKKDQFKLENGEIIISKYINEQPQIIRKAEKIDGVEKNIYEKEYYEDGNLLKEGPLKDDKRDGMWKSYYRDGGTLWSEGEFTDGMREGITKSYHPNGQVRYAGSFTNGKKFGEWRFYDENGELLEIKYFQSEPPIE